MKETIQNFYDAFANLDAERMVACYHADVVFTDPAFGTLTSEHAKNMWRMLCESQKGKGFKVVASNIQANQKTGSAHWEAFYVFTASGRKVHNKIDAHFEFENGLIIKHTDDFNLHAWAKQALGFKGLLLGGTNFFQKKLQSQTNSLLRKFEARKNEK